MQKAIAEEVTIRVHGEEALRTAIAAANILFGKSTADDLKRLNEKAFLSIFDGVPQAVLSKEEFTTIGILDALAGKTGFLTSNSEARRELKANAISVNKEKIGEDFQFTEDHLINGKYVLLGKGKKNNYILIVQ